MKLPTGKQMAEIDKNTINKFAFPSILLMENAGRGICDAVICDFPEINKDTVVIFIGPGNNGGDAFVISRQFSLAGISNICVFIGDPKKLTGDAKINYDLFKSLKLDKKKSPLFEINSLEKWEELKYLLLASPFLIDGLFGTGIDGEVKGIYKNIIDDINEEYKGIVLSIDVPSGLICDDVKQNKSVIISDKVYTIGLPKLGMVDYSGKKYCPSFEIIKIGFPEELLTSGNIKNNLITKEAADALKPQRKPDTHKGDHGHLLVIAGSGQYHGAAHLCSMAGSASGAGLVTLASVFTVCHTLKSKDNEIITFPFENVLSKEELDYLKKTGNGDLDNFIDAKLPDFEIDNFEYISEENFNEIEKSLHIFSSCVLGPGLGQSSSTFAFIEKFMKSFNKTLILDADALNCISNNIDILKECKGNVILTPHIGEFSRLIDKDIEYIKTNKSKLALEFAKKFNVILILKDAVTVISDGNQVYYNSTGNSGLSKGGSGDVLAGLIGGFTSRKMQVLEASIFSTFLHGYIADIIAGEKGIEGVTPSLLIENVYRGFLSL